MGKRYFSERIDSGDFPSGVMDGTDKMSVYTAVCRLNDAEEEVDTLMRRCNELTGRDENAVARIVELEAKLRRKEVQLCEAEVRESRNLDWVAELLSQKVAYRLKAAKAACEGDEPEKGTE